MSGDLGDRLRALPPELADVPDRVQRVRRLARRRRRIQLGAVAAGTAIAVVVPVVLTSALASQHSAVDRPAAPQGPSAEFVRACAVSGVTSRPVQAHQLTRTSAEALAVVRKADPNAETVSVVPAMVTDPLATKVGLGSPDKPRPMWMAYVVDKVRPPSFTPGTFGGPPALGGQQVPGLRLLTLTMIDDATLTGAGNLSCGPISAASDNRGYGIPDNTRVTVSGPIVAVFGGHVICRSAATAQPAGPSNWSGPYCSDQVALHGDDRLFPRETTAQGHTVTGTWQHNAINVDTVGVQKRPTYDSLTTPPCPEPAGGWASVPPSKTPNLDDSALHHYQVTQPGHLTAIAFFRPANLKPVLTVASTDPEATRAALQDSYPRALCVVRSRYTYAQVSNGRRDIIRAFNAGRLPGVYGYGGSGVNKDGQPTLGIDAASDRPELHQALANIPAGLLVVTAWIQQIH